MFAWFKRKKAAKALYPESLWTVFLDGEDIRGTDQTGATMFASKNDLTTIAIETNDSGPWGADVWWLLFGSEGQLICCFPQGATGEKDVIGYLMSLPGFNNKEMIKAMGSTANTVFEVWQRNSNVN